ncbi:MAG: hypothetical protein HUU22_11395 [Phycisphaerae bacterium]|nr:hypothetical protein [Phycisphaerae bacterium]NUQ46627.1 hypothetical protein [Phycisphaerae bacterium]
MRGGSFSAAICGTLVVSAAAIAQPAVQPRMGQPLAGLTPAQLDRFQQGGTAFGRIFSAAEGLGPIFNQQACASCHNNPVGGSGSISVTRFGYFDEKAGGFDPMDYLGGSLLQSQAISTECAETVPPWANVVTTRITTSTLGAGLIEAIPDAAILANESPGPGVSGRAHMTAAFEDPPNSPLRVGRFGWKAQVATVLTFSADAALNEMGITNRFLTAENDPNGFDPPSLAECDSVPDPEDGPDAEGFHFIDRVTDFQRFLAAPPQTPRFGMTGETLFNTIGCNACHVASYTTADDPALEDAIRNKVIRPYSDFLLHDMGLLGDGIAQGDADVREIRTPPLWGVRARDPLLHDGRVAGNTFAARMNAAIAAHNVFGSEAAPAAQAYSALLPAEKNLVISFLDSLGRAEFDMNGDGFHDAADYVLFASCFSTGGPYTPDDPCAIGDLDQDGDVDAVDAAAFATVLPGGSNDCNGNGTADLLDVVNQTSRDCNANAVPDECDPESSDVGLFVAVVLGQNTNPVHRCMMDFNGDGLNDGDDIAPFVAQLMGP